MKINLNTKIGFVGLGMVGGNLYNNFNKRKYKNLIRYDVSPEFCENGKLIKKAKVVFIAVPANTTPWGFDVKNLVEALELTNEGSIVVIKSTVPPEILRKFQKIYYDRTILFCPEFLTEKTAEVDTDFPDRNIVGVVSMYSDYDIGRAKQILKILPKAEYNKICTYEEASLIKYAGNCFFYVKNVFFNVIYDLAKAYGADWDIIRDMIISDSRINPVHTNPVHKGGRGAGNKCLIKDFAELNRMVDDFMPNDKKARKMLKVIAKKNRELLLDSGKDVDLVNGVYGKSIFKF